MISTIKNLVTSALAIQANRSIDVAFNFSVLIDDGQIGDFMAVEGLSRSVKSYDYQEGGKNDGPRRLQGEASWGDVVLKSGYMNLSYLYDWANKVENNGDFRREVVIMQQTRNGKPLRVYALSGAWPLEWKTQNLDSGNSNVPVEEVKLAVDSITLVVTDLPE